MEDTPTSYHGNLVTVIQGLQRLGLDVDAILVRAGVDLQSYTGADQRIPWESVDRVWALAVEETGNASLGLDVVEDLNPAVYRSLGIALLCSSSLRDFLERFERFFAVISTLETTELTESRGYAILTDRPLVQYSQATLGCHSDAFAAFLLKFVHLVKPDYTPAKVQLAWLPPEENHSRYIEYFGCTVEFDCRDSAVFFHVEDLDQELVGANPDIARQNDHIAMSILEKMQELDLPTKVYTRLIDFLPSGNCSRERVAQSLFMSESAFQKKLKAAGTSYQELLDNTRTELAQHYLADPAISVDEVAYLLGFSDCSNFTRAFKRWLSMTPREYRKSLSELTPTES